MRRARCVRVSDRRSALARARTLRQQGGCARASVPTCCLSGDGRKGKRLQTYSEVRFLGATQQDPARLYLILDAHGNTLLTDLIIINPSASGATSSSEELLQNPESARSDVRTRKSQRIDQL
jgi:hypothetical protein